MKKFCYIITAVLFVISSGAAFACDYNAKDMIQGAKRGEVKNIKVERYKTVCIAVKDFHTFNVADTTNWRLEELPAAPGETATYSYKPLKVGYTAMVELIDEAKQPYILMISSVASSKTNK